MSDFEYRRSPSPTESELPSTPPRKCSSPRHLHDCRSTSDPARHLYPGDSLLAYVVERFGLTGMISLDEAKVKEMDGEFTRILLHMTVKILRELPWVDNKFKGKYGDSLLDDILVDMGVRMWSGTRTGYTDEEIHLMTHENLKMQMILLFRNLEMRVRPDKIQKEIERFGLPIRPTTPLAKGGKLTDFDRKFIRDFFAQGGHLPNGEFAFKCPYPCSLTRLILEIVVGTSEPGKSVSASSMIWGSNSTPDNGVSGPPIYIEYVPFASFETLKCGDMLPKPYFAVAYGREVGMFGIHEW